MNDQPTTSPSSEDPPRDILAVLERAHMMSVSDPSDPARRTLYSEAADEIRSLREQLAVQQILSCRTEWAIQVLWADPIKSGAKGPWSQYGPFEDEATAENFLADYRSDRAIAATRVLTRTAAYTDWTGPADFDLISDQERDARLDALWRSINPDLAAARDANTSTTQQEQQS